MQRLDARPDIQGKFFSVGGKKFWIRGVTYGAFRRDAKGREYHDLSMIDRDFALMAANGVNTVRIPHTTPPVSLLDAAERHGLKAMVGLSAEQYVGYLTDTSGAPDVHTIVREKVHRCAGHPALLCYAIGNEIPAPAARWLGRRRVERYLERLCDLIKTEDAGALVTYVNYPSTEYLQLPFLDFVSFNVYLESQERLAAYLPRLQNIAGDRPLVMTEVGLDSLRNGVDHQARVLDWQVRTAFAAGCAGLFIFAWTDEWHRAGHDVDDWCFGLTDRQRRPKPALAAVTRAFADVPVGPRSAWPRISVVVCTYNGARTIRDCLDGLRRVDYPDYEVIVVNDGSTDHTADIVAEFGVRLINTPNRGLSAARNTGLNAASGEIVAYIDDDAYPDRDWLRYLADSFLRTSHAAVGGPNIPPPGTVVADAVANAPGGPVHVLLSDDEAEHIPGCNMAFRKDTLAAIGGFDARFRTAGDDVDVCWRIRDHGWTIGFNPGAMVWHYRRGSIRAYWRQQRGYGRAEALLEQKWPDKYNSIGHATWAGRIYGNGDRHFLPGRRSRIYHGTWGLAPFQPLYSGSSTDLGAFLLMPEWNLLLLVLAAVSALGFLWKPLFLAFPLVLVGGGAALAEATVRSLKARWTTPAASWTTAFQRFGVTLLLHLIQPLARLTGRMRHGLTPWRHSSIRDIAGLRHWQTAVWTEKWVAPEARIAEVEASLAAQGLRVRRGGDFDSWDLELRLGLFGGSRLLMAVEDHGGGSQFVRARVWPRYSARGLVLIALCSVLFLGAARDHAWAAAALLGMAAATFACGLLGETSATMVAMRDALKRVLSQHL